MIIEVWNQEITNIVLILNSLMISFCQLLSLMIIFFGVVRALVIYVGNGIFRGKAIDAFQQSRLSMSYSFSLGLSFLIGASILKTTASSQWEDFAKLTAIIAVRTVLNLLLERSIKQGNASTQQEEVSPL